MDRFLLMLRLSKSTLESAMMVLETRVELRRAGRFFYSEGLRLEEERILSLLYMIIKQAIYSGH
jgi:hypothetical protein